MHENVDSSNYILISRDEYDELKEDAELLSALRAHGVDNWSGYEFVMQELYD